MMLMLPLVSISCTSSPKKEDNTINGIYFPPVPDPVDYEGNPLVFPTHDGVIEIPLWYWQILVEHIQITENKIEELMNQ